MMKPNLKKAQLNREGFSLVEILMVLFILSVGILPLAVIQHQAKREVTEADNYTKAMLVSQEQMERIKGMGFGTAVSDSGTLDNIGWNCQVSNQSFGLDHLKLTTTWQSRGETRSMTIVDFVSMR